MGAARRANESFLLARVSEGARPRAENAIRQVLIIKPFTVTVTDRAMGDNLNRQVLENDSGREAHLSAPSTAETRRPERAPLRVRWRDQLRIGLGSKWIALAGYGRGLRPSLNRKEIIAVESSED